jgi:transcriptional regulator with XRE-family HTH domain
MTPFATRLRTRAKDLGLSNAEVARRAGLSERRYGNYVLGRTEPDLKALSQIARALGLTPNDLLDFDQSPASTPTIQEKITLALGRLAEHDLEVVLVQVEALAKARSR